jgi:hypothetical protein
VLSQGSRHSSASACVRYCSEGEQEYDYTYGSDVVVLAMAEFMKTKPEELWIAIGTGARFRYFAVHKVAKKLDPRTCATRPVFHAFTGRDTVFAFAGRGKKTAWDT